MAKLIILRIQVYSFGTNWLQHLAVVSGVLGLSHIKRLQFVGQLIIESHSQLVEYRCFGLPARLTDPKHRYLTSWERDSIISSLTNWNFNGGADLPMCKTRRLWLVWRKKKMQTSARKRSDISGYARNVQCQHLFWQLGWNETADVMGTDKSMTEFKCVFDLPHVQTG